MKNILGREVPDFIEGYGSVKHYEGAFARAGKSSKDVYKRQIQRSEQSGLGRYGAEDFLTEEAMKLPAGSEGLLVMPDFLAPRSRPYSSGTVIGFRPIHTRAYLFRAFIEGIAMTLRLNSESLKESMPGLAPIKSLYVGGGGS